MIVIDLQADLQVTSSAKHSRQRNVASSVPAKKSIISLRCQHVLGIMSLSNNSAFMCCSFKGFHILQTGFSTSKRIISGSHLQTLIKI